MKVLLQDGAGPGLAERLGGPSNVVVAPHAGWLTTDTFAIAAENVRRLGAGEPLLHRMA